MKRLYKTFINCNNKRVTICTIELTKYGKKKNKIPDVWHSIFVGIANFKEWDTCNLEKAREIAFLKARRNYHKSMVQLNNKLYKKKLLAFIEETKKCEKDNRILKQKIEADSEKIVEISNNM